MQVLDIKLSHINLIKRMVYSLESIFNGRQIICLTRYAACVDFQY